VNVFDVNVFDVNVFDVNVFDMNVFDVNVFDVNVFDMNVFDVNVSSGQSSFWRHSTNVRWRCVYRTYVFAVSLVGANSLNF